MIDTVNTLASQCYYTFWSNDNITRSRLANHDYTEHHVMVSCCGISYVTGFLNENYLKNGRNNYYLIIVLDGKMKFSFDGESFMELGVGDAVVIDKNTPFIFRRGGTDDEGLRYVWIHFSGSDVLRILAASEIELNKFFRIRIEDELIERLESLFYCYRLPGERQLYMIEMALRNLLFDLGSLSHTPVVSRLDRSIRYIHQNLKKEITLEELAAMEFLGVSRYRELFKETTGMSPGMYITELRITKAQGLLTQCDISISDVAARVGYSDRLYFQRIFKKYTGMTPGEYRKRAK